MVLGVLDPYCSACDLIIRSKYMAFLRSICSLIFVLIDSLMSAFFRRLKILDEWKTRHSSMRLIYSYKDQSMESLFLLIPHV